MKIHIVEICLYVYMGMSTNASYDVSVFVFY